MKTDSIIKMIDTYIIQLKEIRKDIAKLNLDNIEPLTEEETILAMVKLLNDKKDIDKVNIINKVAILCGLKVGNQHNEDVSMNDITETALEEFLISCGYEFKKKPNSSNNKKNIIEVARYNGKSAVTFYFDENGYCYNIHVNKD